MGSMPLMAIIVIAYNIIAFLTGPSLDTELFTVALISGANWGVAVSDALLSAGLVLLFLELVSATRTGTTSIINHALSLIVLLVCLIEFIALPAFGNSTFFLITLLVLLDVVAGFTVTITTARRDFSVGE
jgi:hypothetical protein